MAIQAKKSQEVSRLDGLSIKFDRGAEDLNIWRNVELGSKCCVETGRECQASCIIVPSGQKRRNHGRSHGKHGMALRV